MVSLNGPLEGQRRGGIQAVVGLAGAALVPGDHDEVLLERLAVAAHRSQLGAAGTAGEEQQDRVVGAGAADHHRLVVAADGDPDQLGDTARHRGARVGEDGVGAGRSDDPGGQRQQGHRGDRGDDAAGDQPDSRPTVGALSAFVAASREAGTQGGAEDHRQQRQDRVQAAAEDEREDAEAAAAAEPDAVHQRAGGGGAGEFEDGGEDDRRQQHRPPTAHQPSAESADGQTGRDGCQCLQGGDRPAWRPPAGEQAPPGRDDQRRGDARPSVMARCAGGVFVRWAGRGGLRMLMAGSCLRSVHWSRVPGQVGHWACGAIGVRSPARRR